MTAQSSVLRKRAALTHTLRVERGEAPAGRDGKPADAIDPVASGILKATRTHHSTQQNGTRAAQLNGQDTSPCRRPARAVRERGRTQERGRVRDTGRAGTESGRIHLESPTGMICFE